MSRLRHVSIFQARLFQGITRWKPIYVQSGPLRHFSLSLGFNSAGVAPLPRCSRKLLDETVKTFAFVLRRCTFDGEDKCTLSVPLRTSEFHYCSWQSLPGVVHWSLNVVLPFRPRVCLLDVSRLLGLTQRPPAPVCCHWDSLTRGRLAVVLETVRVIFLGLLDWFCT